MLLEKLWRKYLLSTFLVLSLVIVFGVPQISAMGMDHIAAASGQQIKLQYAFHLSVDVDRQVTEFGDLNKNIFW